jgi:hypothetical protein
VVLYLLFDFGNIQRLDLRPEGLHQTLHAGGHVVVVHISTTHEKARVAETITTDTARHAVVVVAVNAGHLILFRVIKKCL